MLLHIKNKKNWISTLIVIVFTIIVTLYGENAKSNQEISYLSPNMWVYYENTESKPADCFLVCPTVYFAENEEYNMPLESEKVRESFAGALNMERGIYDGKCNMFAPYYRQASLEAYDFEKEQSAAYFDLAYQDVENAFSYYMEHDNHGRPIILAGFSQGADMCLRLLKERFDNKEYQKQLIACYAIGWRVTEEECTEYPWLKFAQGESDTGVIIAFNSESEEIDDSLMIPNGIKTLAINPLNWETDATKADKSLNLGACFTDYSGAIVKEIPELTGAYIDEKRGALKITDVTSEEYPAILPIFQDGIYHLYDYQFFYRNLQQNVKTRVEAYQS